MRTVGVFSERQATPGFLLMTSSAMTFLQSLRQVLALSGAAIALSSSAIGLHSPAQAGNSGTPCDQGDHLGTFALRSERNNLFVKASGNNKRLKAQENDQPTLGSWGSFDIYIVGGNNNDGYVYALRSNKDPNRWATIERNDDKLKLQAKECTTTTTSKLFKSTGSANNFTLLSLKNNKYIGVKNNQKLVADKDNPSDQTKFRHIQLAPSQLLGGGNNGGNNGGGNQGTTPLRSNHDISGYWRGQTSNRTYIYRVDQSPNKDKLRVIQYIVVGANESRGPVSTFYGDLRAQTPGEEKFSGEWKYTCNNNRLNATLLYRSTGVLLSEQQGNGRMPVSERFRDPLPANSPAC